MMKIKIALQNRHFSRQAFFLRCLLHHFDTHLFPYTTQNVNLSSWLNNSQLPCFWKGSFYTLPKRQVNFTVTYRDLTKLSAGQTVRTALQERYGWRRVVSRGHHHCALSKKFMYLLYPSTLFALGWNIMASNQHWILQWQATHDVFAKYHCC
jgi:hypothetical protein